MNVLISGASIGGTVLAYWLRERGAQVTLVERAPAPRGGGQAIDIRGAALTVAERMGVLEAARALKTEMLGMSVMDGDGNEVMRSEESTFSGGRLDSPDIEIMREDLMGLLLGAVEGVEILWGDSIDSLDDDGSAVQVRFERNAPRAFDMVVGADGLHSNTRALVFGEEGQFVEHLGTYLGLFRAENFLDLDRWQVWHREGTAGFGLYPARGNGELVVNLGFESEPIAYDHRDTEQQKRLLAAACADLRWVTPKLLEAMWAAGDFYFDVMAQIHLPEWHRGRVALVGDAAFCASPKSGQGTSLAMVGAYVLAEEMAAGGGFGRYQERMREYVELNQALAKENPVGPASEESVRRAADAITL
ncbi:FAD-dependent monooxygenase [Nonomuraea endophytica]|uniref:2-polyprenyl-6-methoxyphenol hydroxylase-like FAD-dependent oxidoreductase n=1 Tax=Nonomuraea endophytica TaxID=714136 RepID=A0A7W7ZWS8_9ACTN|nr:FAD-dependent monooxygenase [Nonomuraea endophytica]MBB5075240.1 2-polyprenyl-6-methoxyphenol hydroxylase-like FAD-dependent oxidoreductase [Nonomuraea endophytica]